MEWTAGEEQTLVSMAKTHSASLIAEAIGRSRNAVLGKAHRLGLSLQVDGLQKPRKARAKLPGHHLLRRSRPKGSCAFSLTQRAGALAALMAGASQGVAVGLIGASKQSLTKNWRHDPAVQAKASEILARALAEAKAAAESRTRLVRLQHEAAMAHNRRVLAGWGERNRSIVMRKLNGEALAVIGRDLGITRERCRQILVKAREQGVIAPPGVNLHNDRTVH